MLIKVNKIVSNQTKASFLVASWAESVRDMILDDEKKDKRLVNSVNFHLCDG